MTRKRRVAISALRSFNILTTLASPYYPGDGGALPYCCTYNDATPCYVTQRVTRGSGALRGGYMRA